MSLTDNSRAISNACIMAKSSHTHQSVAILVASSKRKSIEILLISLESWVDTSSMLQFLSLEQHASNRQFLSLCGSISEKLLDESLGWGDHSAVVDTESMCGRCSVVSPSISWPKLPMTSKGGSHVSTWTASNGRSWGRFGGSSWSCCMSLKEGLLMWYQ